MNMGNLVVRGDTRMTEEQTVESPVVGPGERAMTLAALEVLLRIWRKAVDCFPDDDLETILVYLTVAAASSSSHLRDPAVTASMDTKALPDPLHMPTSGRAIAEATGLARETVRRRIETLVAAGRLARDARGVRTLSGTITHDQNLEFVRFLIREMNAASDRIRRFAPVSPDGNPLLRS
jgi:hypothetical protein